MRARHFTLLLALLLPAALPSYAQRMYAPHSVLASGNWYKISVKEAGIYKMDIPFLNTLGITGNIPSQSIRLYGNGGKMLDESNAGAWTDDLIENAITVVDGGDGVLNGSDYILFYAQGPHEWLKDSANSRFRHRKNLYSDKAFYFLSIGGMGKRVAASPLVSAPNLTVTDFSERVFYELDSVNFLGSGKEWYGEEFADAPGKMLSRNFSVQLPGQLLNAPVLVMTNFISRSVGSGSRVELRINGAGPVQAIINPVGSGTYDPFAQQATFSGNGNATQDKVDLQYTYFPGSFNAQGWLNWFEIFTRRKISLAGAAQLAFRDWPSVGNNRAAFIVDNATNATQVWDVTEPLQPFAMQGVFNINTFDFVNDCSRLREYIAFNPVILPAPANEGRVAAQDLHNTSPTDFIIVTYPLFIAEAERLAQFHRQRDGMRVLVATTEQVYNEFAGGSPDPTAIRDFVKIYYDRYGNDPANNLKNLLLFGDASYDYKDRISNNTNYVPAYQNAISLDPLSTYASDDFFGFLDDEEDINSGLVINDLDIGIGRIPAKNVAEAKNVVDKIEAYYNTQSFGPWRNNLVFIADDEDNNLHLQDAEIITATAAATAPVFNQQKIYLDAFLQESGPGGSSYPQANQAINNLVYNGTLIWNYNGHGGPARLAEETIIDQGVVNNWNNLNCLPLFITATCDFAPYDNPLINSLGENLLLRSKTGAIALMTTTRVVFAFSNRIMNNNYIQSALEQDANGRYRSLGEAMRAAKNYTYQTSGDFANNRKFTLLGNPAMTLAFPVLNVMPVAINGTPIVQADTLRATDNVIIEGEVTNLAGTVLNDFNGNVHASVFDKPQTVNTVGNDPTSQVTGFQLQNNLLFRGKARAVNGRFSVSFKVPKDINYQFGNGKLSLYAEDGARDANGSFTNFVVGGMGSGASNDTEGPEIRPFLNDDFFVNGGITNQNPVLILKLSDSSGINTTGAGVGHDMVAMLDNDNRQFFILNDFYQAELDSYQRGEVRFQLPEMAPGPHSLKIKAWDVLNNSNEVILEFIVANDEELHLSHVLNYPNPFSTHTHFWFEHNKPGQPLQVTLQIMTLSGRVVKSLQQTIITGGTRSAEIEWDGRDEFGSRLGRGVYIYKLRVTGTDKKKKEVWEKLVIF